MEYRDDDRRLFGEDRPSTVKRFARFWGRVLVVLLATWGISAAMLSIEPRRDPPMPRAQGAYEPKAALLQLRNPCELPYLHCANGRCVRGCAK